MSRRQALERGSAAAVLLVLAVAVVYLPARRFDFINYDDPAYVTGNLHILGGLTWQGLAWAFTHSCVANWHPVTFLSHMLDCQLYGLNPAGHHLTNILLHAANSVLLFALLQRLTGAFWRSVLVAALFALHPMHVESVAWIAERKDVLSAFFGLLCLWAYTAYVQAASPPQGAAGQLTQPPHPLSSPVKTARGPLFYYLLSLILLALALMSKAMLVTWPCVMLLLDFWPLKRLDHQEGGSQLSGREFCRRSVRLLREKAPFFALSVLVSVVTFLVVKSSGGVASSQQVPFLWRVANVPVNYVRYLAKLIWPSHLALVYPYVLRWPAFIIWLSTILLAGITLVAVWRRIRQPYLLTGWLWFLGTLVPVIGLVQAGNQSIADRFTYLPSIGIFLALVWGGAELLALAPAPKVLGSLAGTAVLLAYTLQAQVQVLYWQNSETIFRRAVQVTQGNFVAWSSLGLHLGAYGENEEAKRCYRAALAVQPADRFAWNGLAMALINQGKYQEAASACQEALRLDPGLATAQASLGLALNRLGKTKEAFEHYNLALELDPNLADAHYNLANALAAAGQIDQACSHYEAAARLDPGSADAHNNLAYMLSRRGNWAAAEVEFRSALILRPDLWQARYGLAGTLGQQGKTREAVDQYRQTLEIKPGLVDALNRLAWILATDPDPEIRQGTEAVGLAERACQLTQNRQPGVLTTLAAAYAETGRFDDAIRAADLAVRLANAAGRADSTRRSQMLLDLFRSGRAYHEPPRQARVSEQN